MKRATAEFLEEVLRYKNAEILEDYSGRGMFGDTTTAVVVRERLTIPEAMALAADYILYFTDDYDESELEDIISDLERANMDSYGKDGIVIY